MHKVSLFCTLYKYIRPFLLACELFTVVVISPLSLVSECKTVTFHRAMHTMRHELLLRKYTQYENNGHLWHVFNLVQRQAGIPML